MGLVCELNEVFDHVEAVATHGELGCDVSITTVSPVTRGKDLAVDVDDACLFGYAVVDVCLDVGSGDRREPCRIVHDGLRDLLVGERNDGFTNDFVRNSGASVAVRSCESGAICLAFACENRCEVRTEHAE